MRAIGVTEFGGPERLQVIDLDEPVPGEGQVRLRVHAATVNPTDTAVREGAYGTRMQGEKPPWVPGMEVAGEVLEVGDGVDHVEVGQQVMAIVLPSGAHGGYSEQLVLPAGSVVARPEGADAYAASTLPMNGLTAWTSLEELDLSSGQTLAVTGAAGSYGGYVVQLATHRGLRVIADAADEDVELVRGLGADEVLPRGEGFAAAVRELVPDGVDGLADGSVQEGEVADAVRDGGGMAVIRRWDGDPGRDVTVHKTWVFDHAEETDALRELSRLAGDGTLTLRVNRVIPADDARQAHELLAEGGLRGRLVLDLT